MKAPKKKRKIEEKTVLLVKYGDKIAIRKRDDTGLLASLYEFPNLEGKLSEKEVQEVTKEIRLALLEADVALPVVKTFIKRVRERAVGHEIIDTLDASQQIIKIVNEELTEILGSETSEIEKSPKIPTIIMMVGLQGAGKTTFAGKLANKLIKELEARPMIIAADIYRP